MARFADTLLDEVTNAPIPGALVYIFNGDTQAALTDDSGNALPQPLITPQTGSYYFNAADLVYQRKVYIGARLKREDDILVGSPPAFRGDPGKSDNTYTSYTALMQSDRKRGTASLSGDTDVPPHPNARYYSDGTSPWSVQPADGVSYQQQGTGAIARSAARAIGERGVSLADFNAVNDGSADSSAAIKAAIKAARDFNQGDVIIPAGGFIYRCDAAAWDSRVDGQFPRNLRISSKTRNPSGFVGGATILYTGTDRLFFLRMDKSTGAEIGNYLFSHFTIQTTNPAGTCIEWNDCSDLTYTPADGGDNHAYVRGVEYDHLSLIGPQGGSAQVGDAIRAAKLFDHKMGKGCVINGFRYGFWERGCDNTTFDARASYCGGNLRREGAGSFSSGGQIRTNWIGDVVPAGGLADLYPIYDSAIGTTYFGGLAEQVAPNIARALICLDGVDTKLFGWGGAGAPMFRLGPHARGVHWYSPNVPQNLAFAPIIDAPVDDSGNTNWDLGEAQNQRMMTIFGADIKAQQTLGRNGRLHWVSQAKGVGAIPPSSDLLVDGFSVRPARTELTVRDYWGKSLGTVHNGGVQIVTDANAYTGWAIRLVNGVASSGFVEQFRIGDQLMAERVLMRVNARVTSGQGYGYTLRKNGTVTAIVGLTFSGGYTAADVTLDLSSYAIGDVLEIGIGAVGSVSGDLFVNGVTLTPGSAAITDLVPLATTAALADVIAYINNSVVPAINAHNAVERRFMRIASV